MVDPDLAFVSSGAEPSKNGISSRSGCFDNGKADNAAARSLSCGLARVSGTLTQRVVHSSRGPGAQASGCRPRGVGDQKSGFYVKSKANCSCSVGETFILVHPGLLCHHCCPKMSLLARCVDRGVTPKARLRTGPGSVLGSRGHPQAASELLLSEQVRPHVHCGCGLSQPPVPPRRAAVSSARGQERGSSPGRCHRKLVLGFMSSCVLRSGRNPVVRTSALVSSHTREEEYE